MDAPRIVSLAVDEETQARWDDVRRAHFPPARLKVGAHVTLFHALPADLDLTDALTRACDREPFTVEVSGVVPLGHGTAYALGSAELHEVHAGLQKAWWEHLTKQDRQPLKAHVTVQNKVEAEQARETQRQLGDDFTAYSTTALGLDLWRYDGGPWTHLRRHAFDA